MDLLNQHHKLLDENSQFTSIRKLGADLFQKLGLPTRKDEDWKYTSVKSLTDFSYQSTLQMSTLPSHETLKSIAEFLPAEMYNIVFVNGRLDKTLSSVDDLPDGVVLSDLKQVSAEEGDAFAALNTAYAGQGCDIEITNNIILEKPLHLLFYTSLESGPSLMTHPRVQIKIGERSNVQVVESYMGQAGARYFTNALTSIQPQKDSKIIHVRLENESELAFHVGRTQVVGSAQAQILSLQVSVGSQLARLNVVLDMRAKNISADMLGVYCKTKEQHFDAHTQMNHHIGECQSRQLYKGILDQKSRAVFNGKVYIHQDAQKANSEQLNSNLLLSSNAEIDTKPQLEIYADDVKASHGATVGQLNKDELFYLMSRGIQREQALPMLSYGFLSGVIDQIESDAIKNWLKKVLLNKFAIMNPVKNDSV